MALAGLVSLSRDSWAQCASDNTHMLGTSKSRPLQSYHCPCSTWVIDRLSMEPVAHLGSSGGLEAAGAQEAWRLWGLRRTGGCGMVEGTQEFRRLLELQRRGGCQPTVLTNSLHGEFSLLNSDHALLVLKQDQRSAYWVFGFPEDLEICLMWLWVEDRAILEVWWAEKGSKHNVRIWQNSKTSCQDLLPSLLNPCAYSKKKKKTVTENLSLLYSVLDIIGKMVNKND